MSKISVTIDGRTFLIEVNILQPTASELTVLVDGEAVRVIAPEMERADQMEWIMIEDRPYEIMIDPSLCWIKAYDGMHSIEVHDRSAGVGRPLSGDGRVKAPIPGLVTRVMVQPGDAVDAGQPLLTLEAMKMENEVLSPRAGVVSDLNVTPGQSVALEEVLVEIR